MKIIYKLQVQEKIYIEIIFMSFAHIKILMISVLINIKKQKKLFTIFKDFTTFLKKKF